MSDKLVMFNGFDQDEVIGLMKLIKSNVQNPRDIAFCMTTETNADWKIRDLIADVTEEHQYMLKMEDERAASRQE